MRVRAAIVATAVALTLALAGCSSSADGAPTDARTKLTVVSTIAISTYAPFYLALQAGYFADAGLDVDYKLGPETNIGPTMLSGQADIGMTGTPSPLLLAQQGRDTKIILNAIGGGAGMFGAGLPQYKDITDCKKMISQIKGQTSYAAAVNVRTIFGANYEILDRYNQSPLMTAAAMSGEGDCLVTAYAALSPVIAAGKMKLLLNPGDKSTLPAAWPSGLAEGTFWALGNRLKDKKFTDALPKFIAALDRASKDIIGVESAQDVARRLGENKDFGGQSAAKLAGDYSVFKPFILPEQGEITEASWNDSLDYFVTGGVIQGNPKDQLYSYADRVDMSFYKAARALS